MICEHCLKRVNDASEVIKKIRESDREYFAKMEENESMASQEETGGIAEVKIECEEYQFADGQALKVIKQEPLEVKQEERPPIRSLAHVGKEKCMDLEAERQQEAEAFTGSISQVGREPAHDENQTSTAQDSAVRSPSSSKKRKADVDSNQVKPKNPQRSNEKIFKCQRCSKSFKTKSDLRKHVELVHEKKKNYTCGRCSKDFYSKPALIRHMATHEFANDSTSNSNRPFQCDIDECGKFFKTKVELKSHKKTHDKSNRIKCPKCLKELSNISNLRRHISEVHEKKIRFKCDFCSKVYFSRNSILVHLRRHLNAKYKAVENTKFQCPIGIRLYQQDNSPALR
jgi:uncharacterized C2H2 Zn-finger protein